MPVLILERMQEGATEEELSVPGYSGLEAL